ncbi:hypothetical protein L2E82_42232 [Cichorium intybus]|uniref:Uncharacterized protein n=1 Tax=Cichorium intybus TaxID=13427 RepID=A0ACB8ZM59_CICIN|nr:hypothetical protein L2E82_42232 [Cichorium intybus]
MPCSRSHKIRLPCINIIYSPSSSSSFSSSSKHIPTDFTPYTCSISLHLFHPWRMIAIFPATEMAAA